MPIQRCISPSHCANHRTKRNCHKNAPDANAWQTFRCLAASPGLRKARGSNARRRDSKKRPTLLQVTSRVPHLHFAKDGTLALSTASARNSRLRDFNDLTRVSRRLCVRSVATIAFHLSSHAGNHRSTDVPLQMRLSKICLQPAMGTQCGNKCLCCTAPGGTRMRIALHQSIRKSGMSTNLCSVPKSVVSARTWAKNDRRAMYSKPTVNAICQRRPTAFPTTSICSRSKAISGNKRCSMPPPNISKSQLAA